MSWFNALSNPFQQSVKKFIYELIGPERYINHDPIVGLLAKNVSTAEEYEQLGKFIAEVYEAGYMRAVEEHDKELKKLGLKTTIKKTEPQGQGPSIFQSEKSS
ncbi:MAG: hypothetical protein DWQ19_11755 [Crenarchaeota archaeon]|nr:MAG: hypothetical protein DWQ19_11755 [Thermoproteota archaeon]